MALFFLLLNGGVIIDLDINIFDSGFYQILDVPLLQYKINRNLTRLLSLILSVPNNIVNKFVVNYIWIQIQNKAVLLLLLFLQLNYYCLINN